jgi:RimJ/RimL family protein N-acetyltransferase
MALLIPTLHTARLLLRPFTDADTNLIFALNSDPVVLRYWDDPPWKERTQAVRFIAQCKQMAEEDRGVRLAIEHTADREFIS